MVSVFTPNIQAESPARGDDVNTWDNPPYDNNNTMYDLIGGGTATIPCSGGATIVLLSSQYRCKQLLLTGALTGSFSITFPSSFKKDYEIQNLCTNTSAFYVAASLSLVNTIFIGLPPGEVVGIVNDGANIKYKSLDRIGSYWDHSGSSVPNWASGGGTLTSSTTTVPYPQPYLLCDGTTFSSSTYPALAEMLGGTTLPDTRGRVRGTLNQATGRMTSGAGGVDGNTLLAAGGSESITLAAASIPAISAANVASFLCTRADVVAGAVVNVRFFGNSPQTAVDVNGLTAVAAQITGTGTVSVNSNNTGGLGHVNAQPTYVGGITMIRAY